MKNREYDKKLRRRDAYMSSNEIFDFLKSILKDAKKSKVAVLII